MDDDVDIYEDLPHFDVNECRGCKEKIKELVEAKTNWEKEKYREDSEWKLKYEKEKIDKEIVLKNSSSLMKTARAEIDRKDRIIMDLRRELEDLKFRRTGYNRSNKRYMEPKEHKTRQEVTRDSTQVPITWIETLPSLDQPESTHLSGNDEEDAEQIWEPNQDTFTVYGERLRRKIAMEDAAERLQREEAKTELLNPEWTCAKVEQAGNAEIENLSHIVKLESDRMEILEDLNKEVPISKFEPAISESGSLHSSENDVKSRDDHKNVYENFNDKIVENSEHVEYEINNRGDLLHNSHSNHEPAYNFYETRGKFGRVSRHASNDRSRYDSHEYSRYPRDRSRNSDYERKSHKLEVFDRSRQTYGKRSRSNYRARSKSHDRRRDEKRSERQRWDNHRNYDDRCEKRREDGLTRERYNYSEWNNRDFRDVRGRLEDKIDGRNDDDNYKNYRMDSMRTEKSRSPSTKSRSSSRGRIRGREIDKRKSRRSRSRERNTDAEFKMILDKERDEKTRGSRDRKIANERNDRDFESSGKNYIKDLTNNELPDERKNHEKSRRNSAKEKTRNNEPDDGVKKLETSRGNFANEETRNDSRDDGSKIFGTSERNSVKDSTKSKFSDEPKNLEKTRRNSIKDLRSSEFPGEMTNLEKLPRDSTDDSTNRESSSRELKVPHIARKMSEIHETKIEEKDKNAVAVTESLENLLSPNEAKDKFIFMLENDSGSPVISLTRQDIVPIGSRSFREEKIENIEKFIQDFQYNENHCVLLGNDISEEPNDENKSRFSTSSIVATLSMDVEDEDVNEKSKEANEELKSVRNDFVCLPSLDEKLKNVAVDKKSKDTAMHKRPKEDGSNKKSKGVAIDEKSEDVNDKTSNDVTIDEKSIGTMIDKIAKEGAIDEKSKDVAIDKKSKDVTIGKPSRKVVGKKSKDVPIDQKSKDIASDKKSKDVSDKKSEDTIVNRSENLSTRKKPRNVPIYNKSKDTILDKKLEDVPIEKKSKDKIVGKKSEDTIVDKKLEDKIIDKKSEDKLVDKKSEDPIIDKKSDDTIVDEKMKDMVDDEKLQIGMIDKKSKDMVVASTLVNISLDKKSEDVQLDKKSKNAAILEKPEEIFVPPLPPSPQILPLPPLPVSPLPSTQPPGDEKLPISEIPVIQEICPNEPDNKKPQTKKAIAKQMKKRPRIPCIPIVSRYSRQRHVMVLADYVASKTMVKSDSIENTTVIEKEKENPEIPRISEVEPKSPSKATNSFNLSEIQPDNSTIESVLDGEKQTAPENVVKVDDIAGKSSKKLSQIVPENSNSLITANEPEVESSSNILTSTGDQNSAEELKAVSATSEKNIVPENRPEEAESIEENKPKVQDKRAAQKLKNSEKVRTTNKSSSSERETRLALKILASAAPTSESGSSNRKRGLPREKENQSKPAKQSKITIVAKRRKPVQLHDSSVASTLVSSAHDRKNEEVAIKIIPVKIEVRGRKLRSADKQSK